MHDVFMNSTLLSVILSFIGNWKTIRLMNKKTDKNVTKKINKLIINEKCHKDTIKTLIKRCLNVQIINLCKNDNIDDSVVRIVYESCKNLKFLCLDYCSRITSFVYFIKPTQVFLSIYGCWRIHKPSKSIDPEHIVVIQLKALQFIEEGGYEKVLEFVSDHYHYVFMNHLKEKEFLSLTKSSEFLLFHKDIHNNSCTIEILNIDFNKEEYIFQWCLHRIENMWMTRFIKVINST